MRFTSKILLWLPGSAALREPTFWESFRGVFGARPDLRSEELVTTRTVLSIAEGMSRSLWDVGVTNAVALVVDRRVLFQDTFGRPQDTPFLVAAARECGSEFARGFRDLTAVYERHESGLHTVLEANFKARFRPEAPCAVISLGSRIDALRPRPDEPRSASRTRVHATVGDPAAIEHYRQGFATLVGRVADAMRQCFTEGRVLSEQTVTQVVKASRRTLTHTVNLPRSARALKLRAEPRFAERGGHYHDPWDDWYDDPGYVEAEVHALEAFAHSHHHHGHGIHIVHEDRSPICEADAMLHASPALLGISDVSAVFDCPPGTDLAQVLVGYGEGDPKPVEALGWGDGASGSHGSSDAGSTDSSWSKDSASSDCASSDCASKDSPSSDCYSSDCSKDSASSDCAASDCASSDCASSDCASSDCASSDCASSDCSSSSSD